MRAGAQTRDLRALPLLVDLHLSFLQLLFCVVKGSLLSLFLLFELLELVCRCEAVRLLDERRLRTNQETGHGLVILVETEVVLLSYCLLVYLHA